jgi:hypothetical protein
MQKCDGTWHASISSVCWAVVQKKNPCIASYDMRTLTPVIHKKVVKAGKSVTKCFIRLAFDATCTDNFSDDIVCTPTQEFYHADTHEWVPARKLHVGDKLLGRNGPEAITHIQYVKQSRTVYAIEVEDTHTFFVGRRSILTHNMFLPGEFATLAISLPASMVTAAGIGACLGPLGSLVASVAATGLCCLIYTLIDKNIPEFTIANTNTHHFLTDCYTHTLPVPQIQIIHTDTHNYVPADIVANVTIPIAAE